MAFHYKQQPQCTAGINLFMWPPRICPRKHKYSEIQIRSGLAEDENALHEDHTAFILTITFRDQMQGYPKLTRYCLIHMYWSILVCPWCTPTHFIMSPPPLGWWGTSRFTVKCMSASVRICIRPCLCHTFFMQYFLQFFTNDFHIFRYGDHRHNIEFINFLWPWLNFPRHRDHYD